MSSQSSKRRRLNIATPTNPWKKMLDSLKRPEIWLRVQLCVITGIILWAVTGGWSPPFKYRVRSVPQRDLYARVRFDATDKIKTQEAQDRARRNVLCFYENDPAQLDDVRRTLIERVFEIKDKSFSEIDLSVWKEFFEPPKDDAVVDQEELQKSFELFRQSLTDDDKLDRLEHAVEIALLPFAKNGLLTTLQHESDFGSMTEILVVPVGSADVSTGSKVETDDVRIAVVSDRILENLKQELKNQSVKIKNTDDVAQRLFGWLKQRLPVTLKINETLTNQARRRAAASVSEVLRVYEAGDPLEKQNFSDDRSRVIGGGQPLDEEDIALLYAEHKAFVKQMSFKQIMTHIFADFGMFAAVLIFLCMYLYYRDPKLITDVRTFSTLLGLFLVAIGMAWLLAINLEWRAELVPLTLFAITVAIAFHREVAVVMSAMASLVFTLSHGYELSEFVILVATTATASLLCGAIRSRTRLVYVGLIAAGVAFPTTIGVCSLLDQPVSSFLLLDATWYGASAIFAGVLMTALLPFLEQWFEIQTDISLLELSDANHPILRELVQRAPGTYNHSINVASISEAAAKSIGANGLLCRVGAYFHDIGKMRKPEYFIENQLGQGNKHDDLVPTMSTLVIVAHVKDGAEMARNHRLPPRIIDLIEQHHGTTLVEYFFNQAKKQNVEMNIVDSDFRYPGPKPQTLEAAVMMISDAVESASRALREPTPARLETLVGEIIKKRLDDGQFDECPITMEQLNTVAKSLIKSLNATYHARVQYPDQKEAEKKEAESKKSEANDVEQTDTETESGRAASY